MIPDHYLHYWSDRYVELALHRRGVPLLKFLHDPWLYIDPIDVMRARGLLDESDEHLPLLPEQRAVQGRLDAEEIAAAEAEADAGIEEVPERGGRRVEPLHHRRHPRRWFRADFRRHRRQGGVS